MRILTGMMAQESQSLAAKPTSLDSFRESYLAEGDAVIATSVGTRTGLGGVIDAANAADAELVPTIAGKAVSASYVTRDAFEHITGKLLDGIRNAGRLDAISLVLHGATVVDGFDDGMGELLRRVRELVGPDMPLTASFDLHANMTRQMVANLDALTGYHTYPHVDMYETSHRSTEIAIAMVRDGVRPVMAHRRIPMILPADNSSTVIGPFADLMRRAEEMEKLPGVLAISLYPVQPWLNISDQRSSVVVVTNRDQALSERLASELAGEFWAGRRRFYELELIPPHEAVRRAEAAQKGPVVFSDGADATSSGSSGDSAEILRALLDEDFGGVAYISIVDAPAVRACIKAGVGATVTLPVGASVDRVYYRPVEVTGTVRLISQGVFAFKGPISQGLVQDRGLVAVLSVGGIQIVLTERLCTNWEPEFYRSLGLDPADAQIIVVKSPTGYRAAYAGIMTDSIQVDAAGPSTSNLRSLVDKLDRVRRPIFPFDDLPDEVALSKD